MKNNIPITIAILSTVVCSLFGFMVCGGAAHAQTASYRIGPRDVISLSIYAGGELQSRVDLTVSGKGTINVPFIGSVSAAGRTISELETLVSEPLATDYFVDPEVNISIKEYHSLNYFISGAVNAPGLYEMTSAPTLLELIAKAGGLRPGHGNVAYIQRKFKGQAAENMDINKRASFNGAVKVDLNRLLNQGDMSHNEVLESGDVVYIPLAQGLNVSESKIYVGGEVKAPGIYSFQPGLTALRACLLAGGFTDYAAPNRTQVIRPQGDEQVIIKIDLNAVKKGKAEDVTLQPGDRIEVPETWL